MKIVMVHDCAFVGFELARELTRRGYDVKQLEFGGHAKLATLKMAWKLRRTQCDLVHAHYCRSAAYAAYLSGKPYLVHCHGSDIRQGISRIQKKCLKKADNVLVSTNDLLEQWPDAVWLPNPVDLDRFKPLRKHDGNNVLYFPHWYEDQTETLEAACEKLDYYLTTPKFYSIPYTMFHNYLNQFDVFVDRFSIRSYSKTALEAMACGLAVIGFRHELEPTLEVIRSKKEREWIVEFQRRKVLSRHEVAEVVDQLEKIYR